MSPPEEGALRKIIADWVGKSDQDIRAAEVLLSQESPLLYPSCFHCQQAAEKYLKAYLALRQIEFPKTHSIRELLKLVEAVDAELAAELGLAASLTPFSIDVRYPGDIPEPSQEEARNALATAHIVRDAVLHRLRNL